MHVYIAYTVVISVQINIAMMRKCVRYVVRQELHYYYSILDILKGA